MCKHLHIAIIQKGNDKQVKCINCAEVIKVFKNSPIKNLKTESIEEMFTEKD